jgi:hypothetical protein
MDVLLGRNAYIQFKDGEDWKDFGCADNMVYRMETELISTMSEDSGIWDDFEGQTNSYSIDLSGLVPINTEHFTTFDLLSYQKDMLAIDFRIFYEDTTSVAVNGIYGTAIVQTGSISAGTQFVNGVFTLKGKGEATIGIPPTCTAEISDYTVDRNGMLLTYTVAIQELVSGTVPRYDYRLDGGSIQTAHSTGWQINVADTASPYGAHVLEIWPVCENGAYGEKTTYNFTTTL